MIVLLIGPSGVGKSFLGEMIAREKSYKFEKLDKYVDKGVGIDSIDLKLEAKIRGCLDSLILQDKIFIIDVGAGFQKKFEFDFFKKYKKYLIYIFPRDIKDLKNKVEGRSIEGLENEEYSEKRKNVYNLAEHQLKRKVNFRDKNCIEDLNELNRLILKISY
ncbi:ATP-binding protein [Patescibacteria group bacterium]|nr:ATP-binding protein [Patescibacteria group bacterium]MDD3940099.1 hypothetical protein [Candidatus Paceibacterota bacterium]